MPTKLLRRKSRKNAHFLPRITTFASDNSERPLAIQNDVLQSTPLISKSLPNHPPRSGNTLLSNEIVHKQKNYRNFLVPRLGPFIREQNSGRLVLRSRRQKRQSGSSRQFSKNFPALENKISNGGKTNFQGRKRSFPRKETFLSTVGKLQFHGRSSSSSPKCLFSMA